MDGKLACEATATCMIVPRTPKVKAAKVAPETAE